MHVHCLEIKYSKNIDPTLEEVVWGGKHNREIRELFGEPDKVRVIRHSKLNWARRNILRKNAGKIPKITYKSLPDRIRPIRRPRVERTCQ